jgi:NDP-sugar pyrophosphorylase family protein
MLGIIMAGGQGSRLMPLTATRPKPMVEVLGRPVIDFVKEAMVQAGIRELVVTTGYRGEQLQAHVESWQQSHPEGEHIEARINQESTPMGTAGSVGLLRDLITTTCVVGSGDAVASFDISSLLKAHRQHGAKVTMALWEVDNPSEFGIVGLASSPDGEVDGDLREGFIRRFLENLLRRKPSVTSSMRDFTSLSQRFSTISLPARNLILANNSFQPCWRWVGQCMLKPLTASGLMLVSHLSSYGLSQR